MRITKSLILSLIGGIVLLSTSSCKKCEVGESIDSGIIVQDVIIYPTGGYMTSNLNGNYHITGSHNYADRFEVSFDGGYTRQAVNYGTYDILANPMTINCEASFTRDVTVDALNNIVRYKVNALTCSSCKNARFVENYVLVPKLSSGATILYSQDIDDQ